MHACVDAMMAATNKMATTKIRPFFFNDTATTEIYTLSLHDALPIFDGIPEAAKQLAPLHLHGSIQGGTPHMIATCEDNAFLEIGRAHV